MIILMNHTNLEKLYYKSYDLTFKEIQEIKELRQKFNETIQKLHIPGTKLEFNFNQHIFVCGIAKTDNKPFLMLEISHSTLHDSFSELREPDPKLQLAVLRYLNDRSSET